MATTLTFSNELNYIVKIVKSFKDFGLLMNGVSEAIENEVK